MNNTTTTPFPFHAIADRNRPRRIVFYGRVSTEHEAQLSALENQMQWYDDQLKYHSNWTLVGKYIDEGITGTQAKKRPAFLQMMEDARAGKFDLIVTREVCRFARNTVDTLIYTRELKSKYGIEVYFVEDNIWTMDGDGELRLSLMATLAQEESRKTSERVKAGQKISRDNGVLYGNGNILGYDLKRNFDKDGKWNPAENTYVINPEQAETVRMIYDMYLNGLGEKKIMNELCRLQRKDAYGHVKWSASKINRILRRSTYKGVLAYGQSYSNNYLEQKRINNLDADSYHYKEFDYPPIVSSTEWDKVQEIRQSKTLKMNGESKLETVCRGKKKAEDVWLRKLKCKCGSSYRKSKWRTNKKTGEIVFGYQCYNQVNNGSKSFREKNGLDTEGYCDIRMVGDWKLDLMAKEVISQIWTERSESVIKAYEMVVENYEKEPSHNKKHINSIKNQIQKNQDKIYKLIDMRTEGELTKEEFNAMKGKLDEETILLQQELESISEESDDVEDLRSKLETIKEVLSECIDFSQPKLPEVVIDNIVAQVTPIDNNKFIWYINLGKDTPPNEVICGVEGRKNNPMLIDKDGNTFSPSFEPVPHRQL